MPATSKAQKRFFYAVKNYKETKGKKPKVSKKIREAAKSMTMKQINDFLEGTKALPEKVKKSESLLNDLVKIANHFDALGLTSEADILDRILKNLLP